MRQHWQRYKTLRQSRRWVRWAEDGVLLLALLLGVMAWQTRDLVPSGVAAPAFSLVDLDGRTWSSEELKGKKVVLHFWAPWCGVCKAETPAISSLHKSSGDDAQVLSVVLAYENLEDVRAFAKEHEVDYPVLLGNDALMRAYRVQAFPTTYFLSEDGRIEHAAVGYTTGAGLRFRLWF